MNIPISLTVKNYGAICLVRNFDLHEPAQEQYESLSRLIEFLKLFLNDVSIYGHNSFENKSCPGAMFDIEYVKQNLYKHHFANYHVQRFSKFLGFIN